MGLLVTSGPFCRRGSESVTPAPASGSGSGSGSRSGRSAIRGNSTQTREDRETVDTPYKSTTSIDPTPAPDVEMQTEKESTMEGQISEFRSMDESNYPRRQRKKSVARREVDDGLYQDLDAMESERKAEAKETKRVERERRQELRKEVGRMAPMLLPKRSQRVGRMVEVERERILTRGEKGKSVDRSEFVGNTNQIAQEEVQEKVEPISIEQLVEELKSTNYYVDRIVPLLDSHSSLPLALGRALGFNRKELMRLQGWAQFINRLETRN